MTTLPITIHPATVHFAIVLPVVAAIFGLIFLFTKSETLSKITARTALLAAVAMIAVWYTGNQAGPQVYKYLSVAGQHELLEHKQLGLYLAIATSIVALILIVGCRMKNYVLQALGVLAMVAVMLTTFLQGKDGGEIAYEYGMPFKAYKMHKVLNQAAAQADKQDESDDQVDTYDDAVDNINEIYNDVDALYAKKKKEADE